MNLVSWDRKRRIAALFLLILMLSPNLSGSKLSPEGTTLEQQIARKYLGFWKRQIQRLVGLGIPHFTEPVHEEITHIIFGCNPATPDSKSCAKIESPQFANSFVIAGVRWNDDPPFRLVEGQGRNTKCKLTETIRVTTQPECWYQLFNDAKKKAAAGQGLSADNGASLLARSHFGDLQFLHSMASRDGETAAETRQKILMWSEFTWKVSHGDYELGTELKDVNIPGFEQFFGHSGWRVQDLFTVGNQELRPGIKDVAFGSLLHMMEDSFPKGHVDRNEPTYQARCPVPSQQHPAPGKIKSFHSYAHQDAKRHGEYDTRNSFVQEIISETPNVIDVGKVLRDFRDRNAGWDDVRPYLECVYTLEEPDAKASAGTAFETEGQPANPR